MRDPQTARNRFSAAVEVQGHTVFRLGLQSTSALHTANVLHLCHEAASRVVHKQMLFLSSVTAPGRMLHAQGVSMKSRQENSPRNKRCALFGIAVGYSASCRSAELAFKFWKSHLLTPSGIDSKQKNTNRNGRE